MVDYFVDLTASSNGDGSTATPWNQLTSTELTTVSGGDFIWFRRCSGSLISFKGGDAENNKIHYIGWPLVGDPYYDQRSDDLKNDWDNDSTQYVQQSSGINNSAVVIVTENNIYLQRFDIRNTYGSNYYQKGLHLNAINNIEVINSKISMTNSGATYNSTVIDITSSSNIFINNCHIYVERQNYPAGLYIADSNYVTFKDCNIDFNLLNNNYSMSTNWGTSQQGRITNCIDIKFINCDYIIGLYTSNSNIVSRSAYGHAYIYNSTVTYSGCVLKNKNQTNTTTYTLPAYMPPYMFNLNEFTEATFINCNFISYQHKFTFISLFKNSATVNIENCTYDIQANSNIIVDDRQSSKINITTLSGISSTPLQYTVDSLNYLISYSYPLNLKTNVKLNNITTDLFLLDTAVNDNDYILNDTQYLNQFNTLTYGLSGRFDMLRTTHQYTHVLASKTYNASHYIMGCTKKVTIDLIAQYNTTKSSLVILDQFKGHLNLIAINNISTSNKPLITSNGQDFSINLKALRNKGFSGTGLTSNLNSYFINTSMNSFNNGTTYYKDVKIEYTTSSVSRTNGADYSMRIRKSTNDDIPVAFPASGDDTVWLHYPQAGTYDTKIYLTYTTVSGVINQGDITACLDIGGDIMYSEFFETFTQDSNSVWDLSNGHNIMFNKNITVNNETYCPIRIFINKFVDDMYVYLDPKVIANQV